MHRFSDLVGYRVVGRQGELGRVVDAEGIEGAPESSAVVVRGGVSNALVFHVPTARLVSVSRESRTVRVDLDVVDFVPTLGNDGTVELHLGC